MEFGSVFLFAHRDMLHLIINLNAVLILFPFPYQSPTLARHEEVTVLLYQTKCSAATQHRAATEQVWAKRLAFPLNGRGWHFP